MRSAALIASATIVRVGGEALADTFAARETALARSESCSLYTRIPARVRSPHELKSYLGLASEAPSDTWL